MTKAVSPSPSSSRNTAEKPSETSSKRLLLLDGHSLAFRAFHALPAESFITSTGQYTNAIYGFMNMLINLLKDERPTHIACAFDESGPTFRSREYPDYKAQRAPTPHEFSGQIDFLRRILSAMGIAIMSASEYEADDLIATAATEASREHFASYIVTGDRDALQLVDNSITVLYPKRGTSDMIRFTPAQVEEKYGLTPQQYPDFAALRGDPSDNLPSVPKVGEKTAAKWIREFGSLSQLIEHADDINGVVGQSFRDNIDTVLLNRKLTQLITDVPLPVSLADMGTFHWDDKEINIIFDQLEFSNTIRQKLFSLKKIFSIEPGVEHVQTYDVHPLDITQQDFETWVNQYATTGTTSIYVSGSLQINTAHADAVSLIGKDGAAYYAELSRINDADCAALQSWLADPHFPKTTFNAKGAHHALKASGYTLAGIVNDVQLAAYLVNPGGRGFTLESLVQRYCHRSLEKPADAADINDQYEFDITIDNNPEDTSTIDDYVDNAIRCARAIVELTEELDVQLQHTGMTALLEDIELPVQRVLTEMEAHGIALDSQRIADLLHQFSGVVQSSAASACALIGETINLNSPKQLQVVLFDILGMPKTKKIKTGYTTSAEALIDLYDKTGHPFLQYLLEHRDAQKLKVTVEGLAKSCHSDGRVHTTFQQTTAATGRLSSTDPNLQNIPVRTTAGRLIRSAFIVGGGYETLLTADYSQIEMRIMAHLCQDAGLIEAFCSGEDLHNFVGAQVFHVPIDKVTSDMRRKVKAMSYGLVYGLSAYGLSEQLRISPAQAGEYMDAYFDRFGGVRDYLHNVVEQARKTGYTETLFGRRRYFPDLLNDNRKQREEAERAALNAPIQGSAADIMKVAMINVHQSLQREGLHSRLLLQIHDELLLEVAPGEKERVTQLVQEKMSTAIQLAVPLDVSIGYGPNWDAAAHD